MGIFELYTLGLENVLNFPIILALLSGSILGILIGALPGMGVTMGLAVVTPLTFNMGPELSMALLLGVFTGGMYGGSISAILLNIPGAFPAVMTTLDGYPMAQRGEAGLAIGYATLSSFIGGIISAIILALLAPLIARFALAFGPQEYLTLVILALSIISYVSPQSMLKGFLAGFCGLFLTTIGIDPLWGTQRFTFGLLDLLGGLELIPVLVGVLGLSQVLINLENPVTEIKTIKSIGKIIPPIKEFIRMKFNLVRSTIIGVFIGALPGAGASVSAIVSYGFEKRFNSEPDKLGTGVPDGIVAAETANNGCSGGALIPALALGIPGNTSSAILIGALILHGLQPGPLLFRDSPQVVSSIFILLLAANITFTILGLSLAKLFAKVLQVPAQILFPLIGMFCIMGSYAMRNSLFDVGVMIIFGVIGYVMRKLKIPTAPLVLGVILGSMVESNFQRTLVVSYGNIFTIFTRPLSATFLIITIILMVAPWFKFLKKPKKKEGIGE